MKTLMSDFVLCRVLADIFHLDDHKTSLKTGIVMDLYYYTLQFAREHDFTKEQTSAFFSIVKKTHEVCIGEFMNHFFILLKAVKKWEKMFNSDIQYTCTCNTIY